MKTLEWSKNLETTRDLSKLVKSIDQMKLKKKKKTIEGTRRRIIRLLNKR